MGSLRRLARMLAQLESESIGGKSEAVREGAAAVPDRKRSGLAKRAGPGAAQREFGKCR